MPSSDNFLFTNGFTMLNQRPNADDVIVSSVNAGKAASGLTVINKNGSTLTFSYFDGPAGISIFYVDSVLLSQINYTDNPIFSTSTDPFTGSENQIIRNIIAAENGSAVVTSTAPLTGPEIILLRQILTAFNGTPLDTTSNPLTSNEIAGTRILILAFTT